MPQNELLKNKINQLNEALTQGLNIDQLTAADTAAVHEVIQKLDQGLLRVCEKVNSEWQLNDWIKKAILVYFRIQKMTLMHAGDFVFWDKIPTKKWTGQEGVRVVPPAFVRQGAFVASGAILMPSYVNIGAFVDSGTMVDTWATVGSCAQIGKNVHLSGGVGIGGVLEPVQAKPVIIEDNAFLGSRCIVVEGVHVSEGAVLGAGVTLTASTKILDVTGAEEKEYKGFVPANCVVIPGTTSKKFAAGEYGVPCALIIGQRSASTDLKTSLTQALRDYQVSV
jgi:2,3,4,5-tetrahydropyridine-2-carboxylate N-succinyltransferase